jgi:hypothetical protein
MMSLTLGGLAGLGVAYGYFVYLNGVIARTKRTDTKAWTMMASYINFPIFGAVGALLAKLIFG